MHDEWIVTWMNKGIMNKGIMTFREEVLYWVGFMVYWMMIWWDYSNSLVSYSRWRFIFVRIERGPSI